MKKFIVLLIALAGIFTAEINAQTCCTAKKECKPKQCCPTLSNCCVDGKSIFGALFSKTKVETVKQKDSTSPPKPLQTHLKEEKNEAVTTISKTE